MKAYLTSSATVTNWEIEPPIVERFDDRNGFVDRIKKDWKDNSRCVFVCSDPNNYEMSTRNKTEIEKILLDNNMTISQFDIVDNRNIVTKSEFLKYDVCFIGGGHVPTQHEFFVKIGMKEMISEFQGLLITISAGSMNCASVVYAQQEYDDEILDENYQVFFEGLGVTDLQIIPHWQFVKKLSIGGKRVLEDIAFKYSENNKFYALVDGSYVLIDENGTAIYGEAYLITNGRIDKICDLNEKIFVSITK